MSYIFQDTLLCDTFNEGHAVAYDGEVNHRVVTIRGDLFEKSGKFKMAGKKLRH